MERHYGRPSDYEKYKVDYAKASLSEVFSKALDYAKVHHVESLETYRNVRVDHITPEKFWREYLWCVYVSGFKASIVTKKIDALIEAYGPWNHEYDREDVDEIWTKVYPILGNLNKFRAIIECRAGINNLGWDRFKAEYLQSPATLKQLPFIGKITCFHLARNIGLDAVKEDLHLVRIAKHYSWDSPTHMCSYLAAESGERIGVVDFVLWAYSAAMGTGDIS